MSEEFDWAELIGDDHLRLDAPPLGQCNRCRRKTWAATELGTEDKMPQPDGNLCGGRIVKMWIRPPGCVCGGPSDEYHSRCNVCEKAEKLK